MNNKTVLSVGAAAIVPAVLYYFLSPFVALWTIANAGRMGDRGILALRVDFPSVRKSLKSQINALMARKAATAPELKGNPFAGFAMMLAPTMADRIVDNSVTPDGLIGAVKRNVQPSDPATSTSPTPAVWKALFQYLDLDHFKATYAEPGKPDQPLAWRWSGMGSSARSS